MKYLALLASIVAFSSYAEPSRPQTWTEWTSSASKGDPAVVKAIQKADWWANCVAWGRESRSKSKGRVFWARQDYLLSEGLINGVDLGTVTEKLPVVGMTTCGAFAVLGLANQQNTTQRAGGYRAQLVFRSRGVYVYTESARNNGNALVSAVQY